MIFDGHAYCFPSLRGDGGFADPDRLRRHLQQAIAMHHQPEWRARDRAAGDNSELIDLDNWPSLDALKEAQFRAAENGRFEWMVEGERYVKQYIPPSVIDMSYPPERLIAEMDYAGVDKALLHRTPYLGIGNEFTAECVQRYPDRLLGLAHVEEWLVQPETDAAIASLEDAVNLGLSGLQFLPPQLDLYNSDGPWDGPGFLPFWDSVARLNIPVFITLNVRRDPGMESYLNELNTLMRWMERYPDVTVVMTHGFPWRLAIEGNGIKLPDEVWTPFFNRPNLYLQLLFPIALGNVWDYPMPQVRPTIQECVKRIGADRLMWGTDIPMVMRFWSYRQNADFIRQYCDFLNEEEMDAIMGGTCARLLGVE